MKSTIPNLQSLVGQEIGVSKWFRIDQSQIDSFADTTYDHQFLHVDPVKAASSPFGGTIAHGFLTLSMLSAMADDALPKTEGLAHSVNYGFNRIRFVSPVRSDVRIRGRFVVSEVTQQENSFTRIVAVTVEIEGEDKPALFADWLTRHYFT